MYEIDLWLNGQPQPGAEQQYYEITHPLTGMVVTKAAACSEADVHKAVSYSAMAFPDWSQQPPRVRRDILLRAADILIKHKDDLIQRMGNETGATEKWAEFNCEFGAEILREAALLTSQLKGEVIPVNKPDVMSMTIRQPVGICLAIAAWNAPMILGCRAIASALACGNCVVFKASELCPATHYLLGEIFAEAGLPPGVLNILSNNAEDSSRIVTSLIAQPAIRHVNFTGSTRVGRIIAELAAKNLKRCLLELGGKAPVLVLDDADLDLAAQSILFGAFANSGQVCMSTERILVSEQVADQLIDKILHNLQQLDNQTQSLIISDQAANHILQLIKDAELKGAKIIVDGRTDSLQMKPSIIDGITSPMALYREESFGPLLCVIRVQDEEEAVSIANDTSYGLAAAIFSRDISHALRLMNQIESGICHINGPTLYDEPQMPFGGIKDSGYGRFGGQASINEFTEQRWVTINLAQQKQQE